MNRPSPYSLRAYIERENRKGNSPVVTFLRGILNEAKLGLLPQDLSFIYGAIKLTGIPIRKILVETMKKNPKNRNKPKRCLQSYYVIFEKHKERVLGLMQTLKGDGLTISLKRQ